MRHNLAERLLRPFLLYLSDLTNRALIFVLGNDEESSLAVWTFDAGPFGCSGKRPTSTEQR
jgi:hypothetical protein